MSAVGAKGRHICVPEGVRGNSTFVIDFGRKVILPRTREMIWWAANFIHVYR